ncbi:hypothetical protein CBR_g3538 [Chara braunii]|uniref:Uncharacterized protein n=1 Tax=Chara braunii TaxID=69332 RepID=A0A388KFK7_CHABU|nr:hypothetical protein CBR_g3538 [Chara braunii]|eukprot:GBG68844.1 hypothetical protein CBR_g3538 [Chara braunii]
MNAIRRTRGTRARASQSEGAGTLRATGYGKIPRWWRWSLKVRSSGAATWRRPPHSWVGPSEFRGSLCAAASAVYAKRVGPIGGYGRPRNDTELMIQEKEAEGRETGGNLNESRVGEVVENLHHVLKQAVGVDHKPCMSTWKSVSYRDDVLNFVGKHLGQVGYYDGTILKVADFETDFEGELRRGIVVKPGNVRDQFHDDPLKLLDVIPEACSAPSGSLHAFLRKASSVTTGIRAVYKTISLVWPLLSPKNEITLPSMDLEALIFMIGMDADYHYDSKGDVERDLYNLESQFKHAIGPAYLFVKELRAIASSPRGMREWLDMINADAMCKPLLMVDCGIRKFMLYWEAFTFRHCVLLRHSGTMEVIFLMQKDLDRMEKFLMVPPLRVKIITSTSDRPGDIGRAFHMAYFIYLAERASDVDDFLLALLEKKYSDHGAFHEIVHWRRIIETIGWTWDLAFKEQLEVLQQYKLFPADDLDSYTQADRQKALYQEYAEMHVDAIINSGHFKNILLYHRWMMMIAFFERHGFCPGELIEGSEKQDWTEGYPYVDPRRVPFHEVGVVNFSGHFVFNSRRKDCLDFVEDKDICPPVVDGFPNAPALAKRRSRDRSQLMDVLSRESLPDLSDLAANPYWFHYNVKADDKPDGRWFFEAGTDVSLLLSEYEDSNLEYAKFFPGATVGLTANDLKKWVDAASAPMPRTGLFKPLYVSFDIEKFSPAFHLSVSKAIDEQWAEAYGMPHLMHCSKVLTEGKIHYIKGNFHHTVDKVGIDFEGFFGRRNTMYHCAVMGYTIDTLHKDGLIDRESDAHFAALIDEGLLRLLVPENATPTYVARLRNRIEEIYRAGSMQLRWDRTFISGELCMFRNEVRLFGHSVTPGLKAALRISNRSGPGDICPSIASDLELVASTARGAFTAGATLSAVYALYAMNCALVIRRWRELERSVETQSVLNAFLPFHFGGLSLSGLLGLSASVVHNDLQESLRVLRVAGTRYPELHELIDKLIQVPVMETGEDVRFSNPHGVRAQCRTIRRDRGFAKMKQTFLKYDYLPAISHYVVAARASVEEHDNTRIVSVPNDFPCQLSERVCHPMAAIERIVNKILFVRSAIALFPGHMLQILCRAMVDNKTEAAAVLKDMFGGSAPQNCGVYSNSENSKATDNSRNATQNMTGFKESKPAEEKQISTVPHRAKGVDQVYHPAQCPKRTGSATNYSAWNQWQKNVTYDLQLEEQENQANNQPPSDESLTPEAKAFMAEMEKDAQERATLRRKNARRADRIKLEEIIPSPPDGFHDDPSAD